jgi:hypothetical protein
MELTQQDTKAITELVKVIGNALCDYTAGKDFTVFHVKAALTATYKIFHNEVEEHFGKQKDDMRPLLLF